MNSLIWRCGPLLYYPPSRGECGCSGEDLSNVPCEGRYPCELPQVPPVRLPAGQQSTPPTALPGASPPDRGLQSGSDLPRGDADCRDPGTAQTPRRPSLIAVFQLPTATSPPGRGGGSSTAQGQGFLLRGNRAHLQSGDGLSTSAAWQLIDRTVASGRGTWPAARTLRFQASRRCKWERLPRRPRPGARAPARRWPSRWRSCSTPWESCRSGRPFRRRLDRCGERRRDHRHLQPARRALGDRRGAGYSAQPTADHSSITGRGSG
jgi:hypothetical protein